MLSSNPLADAVRAWFLDRSLSWESSTSICRISSSVCSSVGREVSFRVVLDVDFGLDEDAALDLEVLALLRMTRPPGCCSP